MVIVFMIMRIIVAFQVPKRIGFQPVIFCILKFLLIRYQKGNCYHFEGEENDTPSILFFNPHHVVSDIVPADGNPHFCQPAFRIPH